jgi:pimeloyl-ACP methyl ester carboxylesterase
MSGCYGSAGASLSYAESGSGEPVVFLHPTPLDLDFWRPLIARLGGVHAITPDLRGHGASELGTGLPVGDFERVPDAPVLSMAQYGSDVLALLDRLAVHKAAFVGCSIGGYVLLEIWRIAPDRVRSLSFICSKPQADAEANRVKRAETIAQARAGNKEDLFDGMAQALIGDTAKQKHPEIVKELRARMTLSEDALVAVQAGLATRADSVGTVATIRRPVLAIAGGEDKTVTPADMGVFRNAPGGCEYHLLADAGHFAAYEQPDRVAGLLISWLEIQENN